MASLKTLECHYFYVLVLRNVVVKKIHFSHYCMFTFESSLHKLYLSTMFILQLSCNMFAIIFHRHIKAKHCKHSLKESIKICKDEFFRLPLKIFATIYRKKSVQTCQDITKEIIIHNSP